MNANEVRAAIEQYRDIPFRYGRLDCFLFTCGVIREVTGKDYAAPWRGRYNTPLRARRIIVQHGGWEQILCRIFGELHPIWSVRPGDPVLLGAVEQDAVAAGIGIYDGEHIMALGAGGLVELPVLSGRGCWRV